MMHSDKYFNENLSLISPLIHKPVGGDFFLVSNLIMEVNSRSNGKITKQDQA